jgi:hypothetical protein
MLALRLPVCLLVTFPVYAIFYDRFEDLPRRDFDFIVIGGKLQVFVDVCSPV